MKNIFLSVLAALTLSLAVQAQDSSKLDESIAVYLSQMPAADAEVFNTVMSAMVSEGAAAVENLAARLVPAAEGANSKVEYLLNGMTAYASAPENEKFRAEIVKGLENAIKNCQDEYNKAFLTSLLRILADKAVVEPLVSELSLKQAKAILGRKSAAHEKTAALAAIVDMQGAEALPYLLNAMKSNERQYRVAALHLFEPYADGAIYADLAEILSSKSDNAVKADIVRWLGSQYAESRIDDIVAAISSADDELAAAAIASAGKIGGEKALDALVSALGGGHGTEAYAALLRFNGDIETDVIEALNGSKPSPLLMKLASKRKMYAVYDRIYTLLSDTDASVSEAAYDALAGVATAADFYALSDLLETVPAKQQPKVQNALKNIVGALPAEVCIKRLLKADKKALYYPVLAQKGDDKAIEVLLAEYAASDKKAALASLLLVDNPEMMDIMYELAVSDSKNADALLNRYTDLTKKYLKEPKESFAAYCRALELKPSAEVSSKLLKAIANTRTNEGIIVAAPYLKNKATADAAAYAIKFIASKNIDSLSGQEVRDALEGAKAEYKSQSGADAGYAVDEIDVLLAKLR